jgi:hypothetical protein
LETHLLHPDRLGGAFEGNGVVRQPQHQTTPGRIQLLKKKKNNPSNHLVTSTNTLPGIIFPSHHILPLLHKLGQTKQKKIMCKPFPIVLSSTPHSTPDIDPVRPILANIEFHRSFTGSPLNLFTLHVTISFFFFSGCQFNHYGIRRLQTMSILRILRHMLGIINSAATLEKMQSNSVHHLTHPLSRLSFNPSPW